MVWNVEKYMALLATDVNLCISYIIPSRIYYSVGKLMMKNILNYKTQSANFNVVLNINLND